MGRVLFFIRTRTPGHDICADGAAGSAEKIMYRATALTLLKYKRWVDARMLSAIAATDALKHPRNMQKMLRLMNHVHIGDMVVRANLTGEIHPYRTLNPRRTPDISSLQLSMLACSNWYVEHVAAMVQADYDTVITYRRIDGKMAQLTTLCLIEQVLLQGTRHRAEVSWLISSCGGVDPDEGLMRFMRPPPRTWG